MIQVNTMALTRFRSGQLATLVSRYINLRNKQDLHGSREAEMERNFIASLEKYRINRKLIVYYSNLTKHKAKLMCILDIINI